MSKLQLGMAISLFKLNDEVSNQSMKKLVLLGAGHAHVHVLKSLIGAPLRAFSSDNPLENIEVTLISPYDRQVYSGMLPGWVAGHYQLDDCLIPLQPLITKAGVIFHQTAATHIDFQNKVIDCANGEKIAFDVLSIDTGPVADFSMIPGADEHAISIRPIESFIHAIERIKQTVLQADAAKTTRIAFVGAGAGGVELALAMQHAFGERVAITLISAANTLPGRVGARLIKILAQKKVQLLSGKSAARISAGAVHLQSGEIIGADVIIAATGASAAPWLKQSGLKTDERGFLLVNDFLQSISHPNVFAAGDCATMQNFMRPKSGVYAVRAGPPIAENLRHYLRDEPLAAYAPQARSLYLVSTGEKNAIASWGKIAIEGRWVWRWKDRIDRGFMAKYAFAE